MTRRPSKPGRFLGERPVLVDGVGDALIDAVLGKPAAVGHPELEVFATVARSRMHETGPGVLGHVVAVEQRDDEAVTVRA